MLQRINDSACVRSSIRDDGEALYWKTECVHGRCVICSDRDGEPGLPLLAHDILWRLFTAVGGLCSMRLWLQKDCAVCYCDYRRTVKYVLVTAGGLCSMCLWLQEDCAVCGCDCSCLRFRLKQLNIWERHIKIRTLLDSTPALKALCRRFPNRAPWHPAAGRFQILFIFSFNLYILFFQTTITLFGKRVINLFESNFLINGRVRNLFGLGAP